MALLLSKKDNNSTIPVHIAFIMDGNGRWARAKGLPRTAGHDAGTRSLERIIEYCYKRNIQYITFYAFSTENWSRPKPEVDHLMGLFSKYLDKLINKINSNSPGIYQDTVLRFLGDVSVLSPEIQKKIDFLQTRSAQKDHRLHLNIAVNYGGRAEIVTAVNKYISHYHGKLITEKDISENLYTHDYPDPDLIIRTAGEVRISNFLLWQAAYAEYYAADVCWPDFTPDELEKAIKAYSLRERRFGGLK